MTHSKAVTQYLTRYAEKEVKYLTSFSEHISRTYVLVVPAYKEHFEHVETFSKHPQAKNTLLIIVLNAPSYDSDNDINNAYLEHFLQVTSTVYSSKGMHLATYNQCQILLVDRTHERAIPEKQGVGLARKIGADIAAQFIALNAVSHPWIFSSDADSLLPDTYFDLTAPCSEQNISACVYNFKHVGKDKYLEEATHRYEVCIKYYRDQLEACGSPYAFHTLGSCLSISMEHYCQVRGFPKRAAGEDFYLLNKLAKLAPVEYARDTYIEIEARISNRVPFGTGPAVARIIEQMQNCEPIQYYNPKIFPYIKELLRSLKDLWENQQLTWEQFPAYMQSALTQAGFIEFMEKRRQQDRTFKQFERSFHNWFDAFQTLKFVRRLEHSTYPPTDITALF